MTEQDKQLLLKDLCTRLPYGVKVWNSEFLDSIEEYHPNEILTLSNLDYYIKESIEVRPYLRPLSSMTDEEQRTLDSMCCGVEMVSRLSGLKMFSKAFNWLNENHFDYRGLIPMGLAIEAPEDMYKTE